MKYTDIPILMYHDVGHYTNSWCVSVDSFEEQMAFLKKEGYKTISLSALKKGIDDDLSTTEKLVVITFDDARVGVYNFAFPILEKYGFTATIYVVPQWIDGKGVPFDEQYSSFLSWEQLKKLCHAGWEIGSHSFDHADLTKLKEEDINTNLALAEQTLFKQLGVVVTHFCYPYGKYDSKVLNATAKYHTSVGTMKGFLKERGSFARQWIMHDTSVDHFAKMLKKPTLALAMIVKDEEKNIERCLRSVYGLVDEIVVVDTGSKDRTVDIVKIFTSKVYHVDWQDDFALARNEALSHVTSDWVFVLDADEVVAVKDYSFISEAMQEFDVAGFRILTRNYCNDSSIAGWKPVDSGDVFSTVASGWFPSMKVRLFQRGFQFNGRIHEMVDNSILKAGGKIVPLPLAVHHFGSLIDDKDKRERYAALGKRKVEENPDDAKAFYELGIQYKGLKEYPLAQEMLERSIALDTVSIQPILNLAVVLQKQQKYTEAMKQYALVLGRDKKQADAYFGLGFCYFQQGKLNEAFALFNMAVQINPELVEGYVNLGAIAERQEKFASAIDYLKKALSLNPQHGRAYYNLGVVYELVGEITLAVSSYQKAIDLNYTRKQELIEKVAKMKRFLKEEVEKI